MLREIGYALFFTMRVQSVGWYEWYACARAGQMFCVDALVWMFVNLSQFVNILYPIVI